MPVDRLLGVAVGARVIALGRRPVIPVCESLLGRVLDADGLPIDGRPADPADDWYPIEAPAPPPMARERISLMFGTGVRAIDALTTIGRGQRVGIFAGSGVGKSCLLGMVARHARADVAVVALVGERGREVKDFLEDDLGPLGLKHAVVFVATSDEPPLRRVRAALAATSAAEYFRDRGRNVVLLMDSITRVAMAQREIGLSMGEPPSSKGYPPSVFSLLPRLVERAGPVAGGGSITGIYSVYVEGDDLNDPIADATRSLLDGHIVLSRDLATRGHFPAIDVPASLSRLMPQVVSVEHLALAGQVRARLAAMRDAEDLVMLGAYRSGTNKDVDAALSSRLETRALLVQPKEVSSSYAETLEAIKAAVAAGAAQTP